MNCMKCGREIPLGQVFCKECLADMAEYPIKPGTPVPLFDVGSTTQSKRTTNTRKQKKPEEQVASLKKWVTGLSAALLAVILGFSITTAILVSRLEKADQETTPSQNYSTMETTE